MASLRRRPSASTLPVAVGPGGSSGNAPRGEATLDASPASQRSSDDRPEVLTTQEAATLLGWSPITVRRKAAAGQLPGAYRLAGGWRFCRRQMEAYAAELHTPPPGWMTTAEVADLLRVKPVTVRRKAKTGRIPARFYRRHGWRFDPQQVAEWLERRSSGPET